MPGDADANKPINNINLPRLISTKDTSLLAIKHYKKYKKGLSRTESKRIKNNKNKKADKGPLTNIAYQEAAFERDYWAGLHYTGLSFEDAKQFAKKHYDINIDELTAPAHTHTNLDDLKICCTSKTNYQRDKHSLLIPSDSEYKEELPKFKPVLLLIKKNEECTLSTGLQTVEYIGPASLFDFFLSLYTNTFWQYHFKMELGCGQFTVHFRASIQNENLEKSNYIDDFINEILSVILGSGRPVRHYNATYYLPLDLSNIPIKEGLKPVSMLSKGEVQNKPIKKHIHGTKKKSLITISGGMTWFLTQAQFQKMNCNKHKTEDYSLNQTSSKTG